MSYFEINDYPNLTHWKHVEEFTLEEAALLLAGIDPLETSLEQVKQSNHVRWKNAYGYMKALESAIRQGVITLVRCIGCREVETYNGTETEIKDIKQSDRNYTLSIKLSIVSRSALFGWIERAKIQYIRPTKKIEQLKEVPTQEYIANENINPVMYLPYYGHKSDGLDYVEDAIKQFWSTFDESDPNTAPTRKEIVDYLKSKGATQNMAEAVNLILRPRDLPKRTRTKQDGDT